MDQERKYILLKKRLDALHYCFPLQLESVPLVEKLLNDLVKTTEGFQQLRKQLEEAKVNGAKNEQLLVPLKRENQRLVNENNQLHMSMIQTKEECESKDTKWRTQIRMLESERNDWKFLLSQKNNQEKKLSEEIQRRNENSSNVSNYADKSIRDQLSDQERKLIQIQADMREAESSKLLIEEKCTHLELQVDNRDKEILRLKSKLDLTGTNLDKLANEYQMQDHVERLQRLQTQLDLMSDDNSRLNDELTKSKQELGRCKRKPQASPVKSGKKDELASIKQKLSLIEDESNDKNRQIEYLKKESEGHQQSLAALQQELQQVQYRNNQLQIQAQNAEQVIAAYQSDKSAFSKALTNLKSDKDNSHNNLKYLQDENAQLQQQLNEQAQQLELYQTLQMQHNREKEISDRNLKRINEELDRDRTMIDEIQEENTKLERELDSERVLVRELKQEFERLDMQKQNVEQLLMRLKQDQGMLKSSADTSSLTKAKLEQVIEGIRRENELLIKEQNTTENLLKQVKRDLGERDRENYDLKHKNKGLNDQVSEQVSRLASLEVQLQQKSADIGRLEVEYQELATQMARLRQDSKQYLDAKVRVETDAVGQIRQLQLNYSLQQNELDELKHYNAELEEKIKQLQEILNNTRLENERLAQSVREYGDHSIKVHTAIAKSKDKDNEYLNLVNELEKVRESERRKIVENERQQSELQRLESQVHQNNKQIEFITKQKDESMREARELRTMINGLKSHDNDSKNTSIKLSEKVNSYELALQDMKEQYQKEQNKYNKLHTDLTDAQQQLSTIKIQKQDLENQVKQLRTLSEGLERSREELLQRLQQKNSSKFDDERSLLQYKDKAQQLEQQNKQLTEQLQQNRRALEQLDMERDEVQNQLDESSERNVDLQQQIRMLDAELQKQQSKLAELSSKGDRGFETAQQLEEKLRDALFKNQKINNDNENLKYTLQIKDKDMHDTKADLQILAKENQQLNNQNVKLAQDRELQIQQIGYLQQSELRLKETAKMLEMEMHDLQINYSEVCAENQRLTSSIQQLSHTHQDFMLKAQELEKEEEFFKAQVQNFSKREEQYQHQIQQMDREIDRLNRKSEEYERQLKELNKDRDSISKEIHSQRKISSGFQANQEEFNRQLAQIEREKMHLQETNRDIKQQLDLKEAQIQWEQKRNADVEQVLVQERQSQMFIMDEMQALKSQNEQLINELERVMQQRNFGMSADFQDSKDRQSYHSNVSGNKDNSQLDSSAGWERLRQESENFKKSLTQAAVSSQYLKMKMKNLQKEYEGVLPSHKY